MKHIKNIPIEGFANVYHRTYTDIIGKTRTEYHLGEVCEKKEELPQHYEYSVALYKHIGVAKIKITMEE